MKLNDIKALEAVLKALTGLQSEEQERVLRWASEKLGLRAPSRASQGDESQGTPPRAPSGEIGDFETLAEAISSTGVKTDALRVLITAAYLSKKKNKPEVTGFEINAELKNIGHRVSNITDAIDTLKNRKPQFVIQTKKNGTAKQARKNYKVTDAGLKHVSSLLSAPVETE